VKAQCWRENCCMQRCVLGGSYGGGSSGDQPAHRSRRQVMGRGQEGQTQEGRPRRGKLGCYSTLIQAKSKRVSCKFQRRNSWTCWCRAKHVLYAHLKYRRGSGSIWSGSDDCFSNTYRAVLTRCTNLLTYIGLSSLSFSQTD
jgi:hypothetical protein